MTPLGAWLAVTALLLWETGHFLRADCLLRLEWGDWTIDLINYCGVSTEWNRSGYDAIWTSWAVTPLFYIERCNLDYAGEYKR